LPVLYNRFARRRGRDSVIFNPREAPAKQGAEILSRKLLDINGSNLNFAPWHGTCKYDCHPMSPFPKKLLLLPLRCAHARHRILQLVRVEWHQTLMQAMFEARIIA